MIDWATCRRIRDAPRPLTLPSQPSASDHQQKSTSDVDTLYLTMYRLSHLVLMSKEATMKHAQSTRIAAFGLIATLSAAPISAVAQPIAQPEKPIAVQSAALSNHLESPSPSNRFAEMDERLARASQAPTSAKGARLLFPGDTQKQDELLAELRRLDLETPEQTRFRAAPAVLAPFVFALGQCVRGALTKTVTNEVSNLIRNKNFASAEQRIDAAVDGCIKKVIPPFLNGAAKKAKPALKRSIIWIFNQFN